MAVKQLSAGGTKVSSATSKLNNGVSVGGILAKVNTTPVSGASSGVTTDGILKNVNNATYRPTAPSATKQTTSQTAKTTDTSTNTKQTKTSNISTQGILNKVEKTGVEQGIDTINKAFNGVRNTEGKVIDSVFGSDNAVSNTLKTLGGIGVDVSSAALTAPINLASGVVGSVGTIQNYLNNGAKNVATNIADSAINKYAESKGLSDAQKQEMTDAVSKAADNSFNVIGNLYGLGLMSGAPAVNSAKAAETGTQAQKIVTDVRQSQNEATDWNVNNKALSYLAGTNDVHDFLYDTMASGVDSVVASLIPGGAVSLGAGAGLQTYNDLKEDGASDTQALLGGITSGVFEGLFEKVSIGNLKALATAPAKTVKDVIKNIAKSTLVNASEEGATELANILYDYIVNYKLYGGDYGTISDEVNALQKQGLSDKEIRNTVIKNAVQQITTAAAGGGLMGTVFGAGGSFAGNVNDTQSDIPTLNETENTSEAETENANSADTEAENKSATENENTEAPQNAFRGFSDGSTATVEEILNKVNNPSENAKSETKEEAPTLAYPSVIQTAEQKAFVDNAVKKTQKWAKKNGIDITDEDVMNAIDNYFKRDTLQDVDTGARFVRDLANGGNPETALQLYVDNLMEEAEQNRAKAESEKQTENTEQAAEPTTTEVSTDVDYSDSVVDKRERIRPSTGTKVSETAMNTFSHSNLFNRAEESLKFLKNEKKSGALNVDTISEKASVEEARERLEDDFDGEANRIENAKTLTGVEIDEAMGITAQKVNEALVSGDYSAVHSFITSINNKIHDMAQGLQALAKYTRSAAGTIAKTDAMTVVKAREYMAKHKNTAEKCGRLANILHEMAAKPKTTNTGEITLEQMEEQVRNTVSEYKHSGLTLRDSEVSYLARLLMGNATKEDIVRVLETKWATGGIGLTNDDVEQIVKIFEKADGMNSESKEYYDTVQEAYSIAAKALGPRTLKEQFDSWRYLAMLGNPRTMIRNVLGNTVFGAVTDMKDALAAGIESVIAKDDRTKAVLTPADRSLVNACAKDFDENAYNSAVRGGDKYNISDEITGAREAFNNKVLNKINDAVSWGLDNEYFGDTGALKRKYAKALAGYLKANGQTLQTADSEFMQKARAYAIQQAQIATFHEENSAAKFLTRVTSNPQNAFEKGFALLINGAVPFKKTPMNILKQGVVEYNPAVQIGMTIKKVMNGDSKSSIADSIAKGTMGGAIMALGVLGAATGVIHGKNDDDDEEVGLQDYSLNIGDSSYTIDWLAPAALPLFMGVALYESFEDDGKIDTSDIMNSLFSIGEPVIEMSMLNGIKNSLDSYANSVQYSDSTGEALTSALGSLAASYFTQAVPTLSGQVARSIDDTRRSTAAFNNGLAGTVEYNLNKVRNKIPFLSETGSAYVNEWGETEQNEGLVSGFTGTESNILDRLMYNMLSPGYTSSTELSPAQQECHDLYETGDVYPTAPSRKYDGEYISSDEYQERCTEQGQLYSDFINAALDNGYYNSLDDESRVSILTDLRNLAAKITDADLFGYDIENSSTYKKLYSIYTEKGTDGLFTYYELKDELDGEKTKAAVTELLDSTDLSDEDKEYYFSQFSTAKNPYIPTLE